MKRALLKKEDELVSSNVQHAQPFVCCTSSTIRHATKGGIVDRGAGALANATRLDNIPRTGSSFSTTLCTVSPDPLRVCEVTTCTRSSLCNGVHVQ